MVGEEGGKVHSHLERQGKGRGSRMESPARNSLVIVVVGHLDFWRLESGATQIGPNREINRLKLLKPKGQRYKQNDDS